MPSRSEFRHLRTLARLLFPPTFCPVSCVSESAPETYKSDHAIYAPSRLRGHKLATFRFKLPAAREIISFDRLNTSGERRSILLGDIAGCEDEHSIAERIVGNIRHCFVDKVIQPRIMILCRILFTFQTDPSNRDVEVEVKETAIFVCASILFIRYSRITRRDIWNTRYKINFEKFVVLFHAVKLHCRERQSCDRELNFSKYRLWSSSAGQFRRSI